MARLRQNDFIQNFRFHVLEATGTRLKTTAGFKSVTTPDLSLGVAEYRDGLTLYTFKQPGLPTISNTTLSQGVTTNRSEFFNWIKDAVEGREYRADLDIDVHDNSNSTPPNVVKKLQLFEAFPIRNKTVADLDANTTDINVRELELAIEQYEELK